VLYYNIHLNGDKVNDIFEQLSKTSSRLEKEAILKENLNNGPLIQAITLALNPFMQFYIRKIPKYAPSSNPAITLQDAMNDMLPLLSSRTVTGNAAIACLKDALENLSPADAKVIEKIIQKDLRCGVSTETVNKIWPNLLPKYPCMLATASDEKVLSKMSYPASAQLKMDGMRFNAIVKDGILEFRSRNGKELSLLGNLFEFVTLANTASNILGTKNVVFDGELMVVSTSGNMSRQQGNGILSKANKGTISPEEATQVHATIWDIIPYDDFLAGEYDKPYNYRLNVLKSLKFPPRIHLVENTQVLSLEGAQIIFEKYLNSGLEGIILKDLSMPWENARAKHQVKFKGELECELECVEWQEGTGKHEGRLGALVAVSSDRKIKVNVGSGYSDEQRNIYTRESTLGKIITVKYNTRIVDKAGNQSLFLPVFIALREDKEVADSSTSIK